MKDTKISLDILFIDEYMNIVGFIETTKPLSDKDLFINKISYNVIEAKGGFIKHYDIKKGDNLNDKFNLIMTI